MTRRSRPSPATEFDRERSDTSTTSRRLRPSACDH
jgi:hypothetical protein